MNSKVGMAVGIVILLLIAAGVYLLMRTPKSTSPAPVEQQAKQTTPNTFSSIAEALAKSLSLSCDYTDNKNVHTVAYIKNGLIRADVTDATDPKASGSVIIKDKKIYYWNAQKTGFMMSMPEGSITPAQNQGNTTGANMMASLEAFKQHCKVATVSDDLFVLPSDITFTDYSQMMRPSAAVTTGGAMPTGVPTQYQQYMQQYQQYAPPAK